MQVIVLVKPAWSGKRKKVAKIQIFVTHTGGQKARENFASWMAGQCTMDIVAGGHNCRIRYFGLANELFVAYL